MFSLQTLVSLQVIGSAFNGPIYEGIFTNFCSLFSSPNFPIMIILIQVAWFYKSIPYRFSSPSPGVGSQAWTTYYDTKFQAKL